MRNIATDNVADLESLETQEWLESLDYVLHNNGPARAGPLLPIRSRPFPAARSWSAASRVWFAGTRLPWSFARTRLSLASAAISPRLHRQPRSTKWASTTSGARPAPT